MPHIVAEPCINCKNTRCVSVCPAECFHEGPNFIVIDPKTCIDCALCVPVCPVHAIYPDDELPEEYAEYEQLNAELARKWPLLKQSKDPLPQSDEFKDVAHKRDLLEL